MKINVICAVYEYSLAIRICWSNKILLLLTIIFKKFSVALNNTARMMRLVQTVFLKKIPPVVNKRTIYKGSQPDLTDQVITTGYQKANT